MWDVGEGMWVLAKGEGCWIVYSYMSSCPIHGDYEGARTWREAVLRNSVGSRRFKRSTNDMVCELCGVWWDDGRLVKSVEGRDKLELRMKVAAFSEIG